MVAAYLRTLNLNETADKLLANMDEAIDFLKRINYTQADMTGHRWETNKHNDMCYGHITDNDIIRNTKGVIIFPEGGVMIAHMNQDGMWTKPYISCNDDFFEITE